MFFYRLSLFSFRRVALWAYTFFFVSATLSSFAAVKLIKNINNNKHNRISMRKNKAFLLLLYCWWCFMWETIFSTFIHFFLLFFSLLLSFNRLMKLLLLSILNVAPVLLNYCMRVEVCVVFFLHLLDRMLTAYYADYTDFLACTSHNGRAQKVKNRKTVNDSKKFKLLAASIFIHSQYTW